MEVLNVQLSLVAYSLSHRTLPRAEQIAGNERGMIDDRRLEISAV